MEHFRLNELLRHVFAGAVLLITVGTAFPALVECWPRHGDAAAVIALGSAAALLAGSLIYVLHRATVYPILYRLLAWLVWLNVRPTLTELDLARYKRLSDKASAQHHLGEWASQVHFLYCVTWALLLPVLIGGASSSIPHDNSLLVGLAIVALLVAVVHHFRFLLFDRDVARIEGGVALDPRLALRSFCAVAAAAFGLLSLVNGARAYLKVPVVIVSKVVPVAGSWVAAGAFAVLCGWAIAVGGKRRDAA